MQYIIIEDYEFNYQFVNACNSYEQAINIIYKLIKEKYKIYNEEYCKIHNKGDVIEFIYANSNENLIYTIKWFIFTVNDNIKYLLLSTLKDTPKILSVSDDLNYIQDTLAEYLNNNYQLNVKNNFRNKDICLYLDNDNSFYYGVCLLNDNNIKDIIQIFAILKIDKEV